MSQLYIGVNIDAGCGEGYLSRILLHRGAQVTGIDISPRLVEMARAKDPTDTITYQVADLSQPLPALRYPLQEQNTCGGREDAPIHGPINHLLLETERLE